MTINKLHYISQGNTPKEHLENIQKACQSGAELVQLRLKNLSDKKVLKTALEAREITSHFQTRLIINDHYKIAKEIKADGVHLGKADTCPTIARNYLYSW
jgi:thiamine-phosphate pyrophosphorylase